VSFSEDFERLIRLVDAGLSVSAAAAAVGMPRSRAYRLWAESGRRVGKPKTRITDAHRERVVEEFDLTGSINKAAGVAGLSHRAARRILVAADRVSAEPAALGKASARERFLQLREQGWSTARAAREVGVNERTGRDWVRGIRRSGNTRVYPDGTVVDYRSETRYRTSMTSGVDAVISDRYLSLEDRLAIADGLVTKLTLTAIAARIGRPVSTVSREVKAYRVDEIYLPYQAHQRAAAARARPKDSKLLINAALREQVELGLERKLSPEQISNRLKIDYPDDESMRVSHETIYQALYFQARGGLKREVQTVLRTGRTRRKPQRKPDQRQQRFVDEMIMISDRPAEVEGRAVPGHWEGDLIMGEGNRSAIGTLVERTTRYTMLLHLPGGHDAEQVRDALVATISTLPEHLRRSLT
jgi:IS30 family transposase